MTSNLHQFHARTNQRCKPEFWYHGQGGRMWGVSTHLLLQVAAVAVVHTVATLAQASWTQADAVVAWAPWGLLFWSSFRISTWSCCLTCLSLKLQCYKPICGVLPEAQFSLHCPTTWHNEQIKVCPGITPYSHKPQLYCPYTRSHICSRGISASSSWAVKEF